MSRLAKGTRSMTTAKDVLKMIKDNDVKFVDFRFTDPLESGSTSPSTSA